MNAYIYLKGNHAFIQLYSQTLIKKSNFCMPSNGAQQTIVLSFILWEKHRVASSLSRRLNSWADYSIWSGLLPVEGFWAGLTGGGCGGGRGGGTLCQTQNLLEGLLIPAGLEAPRDPPEELEDVAGAALHSLLPPQLSAGWAAKTEQIDCQVPQMHCFFVCVGMMFCWETL